ncbi:MAG: hypothetical protein WDN69_24550 [Aliidongia sp.]
MTTISTEQFQSFTAARHALFTAIMDAAVLNTSRGDAIRIEPVTVTIIPDTEPAPVAIPELPKEWTERAAKYSPSDPILHAAEVAELEWHEHLWFIEALVHSLRDGVPGEPQIIVTAPDIVIYVTHTPNLSDPFLDV